MIWMLEVITIVLREKYEYGQKQRNISVDVIAGNPQARQASGLWWAGENKDFPDDKFHAYRVLNRVLTRLKEKGYEIIDLDPLPRDKEGGIGALPVRSFLVLAQVASSE
jgi:hypothetical protein